jgi:phosphate transport system substrate-binding protein
MQAWANSWDKDGPLAKVGMVAMPADVMAANAAKVKDLPALAKDDLAKK